MEDDAADELDVEVTHMEEAAAGFADDGEGFGEEVLEGGALGEAFAEFDGFGGEVDIGEGGQVGLEVVDGGDEGLHGLDLALVFGAEDFGEDCVNHRGLVGEGDSFILAPVVGDGGGVSG